MEQNSKLNLGNEDIVGKITSIFPTIFIIIIIGMIIMVEKQIKKALVETYNLSTNTKVKAAMPGVWMYLKKQWQFWVILFFIIISIVGLVISTQVDNENTQNINTQVINTVQTEQQVSNQQSNTTIEDVMVGLIENMMGWFIPITLLIMVGFPILKVFLKNKW